MDLPDFCGDNWILLVRIWGTIHLELLLLRGLFDLSLPSRKSIWLHVWLSVYRTCHSYPLDDMLPYGFQLRMWLLCQHWRRGQPSCQVHLDAIALKICNWTGVQKDNSKERAARGSVGTLWLHFGDKVLLRISVRFCISQLFPWVVDHMVEK